MFRLQFEDTKTSDDFPDVRNNRFGVCRQILKDFGQVSASVDLYQFVFKEVRLGGTSYKKCLPDSYISERALVLDVGKGGTDRNPSQPELKPSRHSFPILNGIGDYHLSRSIPRGLNLSSGDISEQPTQSHEVQA